MRVSLIQLKNLVVPIEFLQSICRITESYPCSLIFLISGDARTIIDHFKYQFSVLLITVDGNRAALLYLSNSILNCASCAMAANFKRCSRSSCNSK